MNKIFIYNITLLLLIIIFSSSFTYYYNFGNHGIETFVVPKQIKQIYRPIERNIRTNMEGFYDKSSTNISNLFRKFGIL